MPKASGARVWEATVQTTCARGMVCDSDYLLPNKAGNEEIKCAVQKVKYILLQSNHLMTWRVELQSIERTYPQRPQLIHDSSYGAQEPSLDRM